MRTRGWAALAATVAFGATGLTLVGPAGAGIGGDADAELTPNPAAPGETVTASSIDPCPPILVVNRADTAAPAGPAPVSNVHWLLTTPDPGGQEDVVDEGDVDAAPDGSWEVGFAAPDEEGDYEFYAFCESDAPELAPAVVPAGEPEPSGNYGPIDLTVAAAQVEFDASLDKASGAPGDDIELIAIECAGDSGAAALLPVGDPPASPDEIDEDVLQQYDVLDGQFGGVVPVPAATTPGTYQVVVFCMQGGDVLDSEVLAYTVLAAAAPVPGAPDFTG